MFGVVWCAPRQYVDVLRKRVKVSSLGKGGGVSVLGMSKGDGRIWVSL